MDRRIGGFLAELRREKNLTQKELADMLHVSDKTISRWERDEGVPDLFLALDMAELLEVTMDELVRGERMSRKLVRQEKRSENISVSREVENTYLLEPGQEPAVQAENDDGWALAVVEATLGMAEGADRMDAAKEIQEKEEQARYEKQKKVYGCFRNVSLGLVALGVLLMLFAVRLDWNQGWRMRSEHAAAILPLTAAVVCQLYGAWRACGQLPAGAAKLPRWEPFVRRVILGSELICGAAVYVFSLMLRSAYRGWLYMHYKLYYNTRALMEWTGAVLFLCLLAAWIVNQYFVYRGMMERWPRWEWIGRKKEMPEG